MEASLKAGECPGCGHGAVLHIAEVANAVADWNDGEMPTGDHPPLPTTYRASLPWRIARLPGLPDRERHDIAGLVEAYVCESCGLTELFTLQPQQIPVDGRYVRRLTRANRGPYR